LSQTSVQQLASFEAGANGATPATLKLIAGRDVTLNGAQVSNTGTGATTIAAQRDVNLGSVSTASALNSVLSGQNYTRTQESSDVGTSVQAAGSLSITAGNDITAKAASLNAGQDATLSAANDILLQAGQSTTALDSRTHSSKSNGFTSKSSDTHIQASSASAQVSTITGQNVSVQAGNNLVSIGTEFKGQDSIDVGGSNNTLLYATQDVSQSTTTTQSSSGFLGIKLENRTSTDSQLQTSSIGTRLVSTQKVQIGVGNTTELQGTQVQAQDIRFVKTNPNGAGELILGGSINTTQTSHTEKNETLGVWQAMSGHGSTVQTLNQTTLNGTVSFDSALKITAQIPDTKGGQDLKSQINALITQGNGVGLDYLNALAANPNVQWDKVALANEHWNYNQQGLTGAGAALLTMVVTYFTMGMGTAAVGTTAAAEGAAVGATTTTLAGTTLATTTAAGVTTYTAAGIAINAGFAALASQAAVGMVNNGGDIGKTLNQLGSSDSIKNILTSMVTAGALDKLNSAMGWQDISPKTADFASNFGKNIANNLASASINSALTGASLEDGVKGALLNAVVSTSMAFGAKAIGLMTIPDANGNATLNPAGQALAHALLGCVSGAATAGNSGGCTPGAAGAVVGELAAQWYDPTGDKTDAEILDFVKVVSATAGALTGDGSTQSVNTAVATGVNAVQNNYLETRDVKRAITALKSCTAGCDSLRRLLTSDQNAGGEQAPVGRLVDLCRADPQACSSRVQDMALALNELQSPETRAVIGAATTDRLIQRQITDLSQALGALQWGADHIQSSTQIVKTALLVGSTAVGAGLLVPIARAVVAACAGGLNPTCSGMLTELGIGAAEAASGVPTLGLSAPMAESAAARLKNVLSQTSDPAVVAQELQAVLAQAKAEQAAANQAVKVGANGGVNPTLLNELTANGVKFTPENVIATARGPSGQVVFLETGNSRAGLQHIVGEHANDFANIGVSQAEIPNVVMQAVSQGKIVGYQGVGTGRPIFETVINGQPRRLAITISDNGFIVGANPKGSVK
jgi:hypothetical protein